MVSHPYAQLALLKLVIAIHRQLPLLPSASVMIKQQEGDTLKLAELDSHNTAVSTQAIKNYMDGIADKIIRELTKVIHDTEGTVCVWALYVYGKPWQEAGQILCATQSLLYESLCFREAYARSSQPFNSPFSCLSFLQIDWGTRTTRLWQPQQSPIASWRQTWLMFRCATFWARVCLYLGERAHAAVAGVWLP